MLNHFPYEQTVVVPEEAEAEEDALTFRHFVGWSVGFFGCHDHERKGLSIG